MKRSQFVKLCVLAGVTGGAGITIKRGDLSADLHQALKDAGLERCNVKSDGETLHMQGTVVDFPVFSRRAGALGDGKVRVKGSTLFFERQGRRMELELMA
jgi:hypothetical protein